MNGARLMLQPWQRLALAMLSGVLIAIPFLHAPAYLLIWVAYVPLLLALHHASLVGSYGLGLAAGLVSCMLGMYWITDFAVIAREVSPLVSVLTGSFLWLASAQVLGLMALALNGLRRLFRGWWSIHDFILFPGVFAAAHSLLPLLFPFHPADTQSRFLSAIQAIEWTGLAGLDALIALVNILLFQGLTGLWRGLKPHPPGQSLRPSFSPVPPQLPWVLALAVIVLWFSYGGITLRQWDNRLVHWQTVTVGIVQPNDAPTLARPRVQPGYSLAHPPEMAKTQQLAQAGATLVVWPEARYKGYFDNPQVQDAYARQLSEAGTHLLFQDSEGLNHPLDGPRQYNSAMLIDANGVARPPYRKIKTMLFGESLPMDGTVPWLNALSRSLFGDFVTLVSRGSEPALYHLEDHLRIVPLICYETSFPSFVTRALPANSSGNGTLLVGMSNNGWFGRTAQPLQHVNASLLRAVENRAPFVHAVNNGPSMVVLPSGRILFQSPAHQPGGYQVEVPYLAPGAAKGASVNSAGR